jgi:glutamyl-tRNA synthetase
MAVPFKSRLAPTPSGFLHTGNCYAFVLTYLLTKQSGGSLLLRIDDLDRARYRSEYVVNIFETLHALGIEWDEGPEDVRSFERHWSQLHRKPLYRAAIERLKEQLYACSCSRVQQLERGLDCCMRFGQEKGAPKAYRLKYTDVPVQMEQLRGTKETYVLPEAMQNFVVQRKNGEAAYQISSLVDDVHFGCTHVVRGTDLFDSTLAQLVLNKYLDMRFDKTRFLHHTLLLAEGGKLSKTQAAPAAYEQLQKPNGVADFYRGFSNWLGLEEPLYSLAELKKNLGSARLLELV